MTNVTFVYALFIAGTGAAAQAQAPADLMRELSGQVFDNGVPLANAEVSTDWDLGPLPNGTMTLIGKSALKTDQEGRFSGKLWIERPPANVVVMNQGRTRGAVVVLNEADLGQPLRIELKPLGRVLLNFGIKGLERKSLNAEFLLFNPEKKTIFGIYEIKSPQTLLLPAGAYWLNLRRLDTVPYA